MRFDLLLRLPLVLLTALFFVLVAGSPGAPAAAQSAPSPCTLDAVTSLSQRHVLAGDGVTVTQRLDVSCPQDEVRADVVLVLDASLSMSGAPAHEATKAARVLVDDLDLAARPGVRVGVVSVSDAARVRCELTDDQMRAKSCINKALSSSSLADGASLQEGIAAGQRVIMSGRSDLPDEAWGGETIVLLTDGDDAFDCMAVQDAAERARIEGIRVMTVTLGDDADRGCLEAAATAPALSWHVATPFDLVSIFSLVAADVLAAPPKQLELELLLPDNVAWIPKYASPPPSGVSPAGDRVLWRIDAPAIGPWTLEYGLRPLEVGRQPIHHAAEARFVDGWGREGRLSLPAPRLLVLGPRVLPTP